MCLQPCSCVSIMHDDSDAHLENVFVFYDGPTWWKRFAAAVRGVFPTMTI